MSTIEPLIHRLEETLEEVKRTARAFPIGFVHQKPDSASFSATEIMYHLCDVEMLWQSRMEALVAGSKQFHSFDPDANARAKNHNVMPFAEGIECFERLRRESFSIVRSRTDEELRLTGTHPKFGLIDIPAMLSIMANHDMTHVAQFERTRVKVTEA